MIISVHLVQLLHVCICVLMCIKPDFDCSTIEQNPDILTSEETIQVSLIASCI